jgi:hypothetical protein
MATQAGVMVEVVDEEATQKEARRIESLDLVGQSLERQKEEAVAWRAEAEIEWTENFIQYNTTARPNVATAKQQGGSPAPRAEEEEYRQSADNITRPKVIITASRLGDMLFPTAEANWELGVPKDPQIPDALLPPPPPGQPDPQTGQPAPAQPYTEDQKRQLRKDVATKRCKAQEAKISDQLETSSYDEVGRQVIFDGCLYGTGVIRAPVLKNQKRHTYGTNVGANAVQSQAAYPCAEYVDLWSFYPQPSRSIDECEHAFQLHVMPKRSVRKLATEPGFDSSQVARLLSQPAQAGMAAIASLTRGAIRMGNELVLKDRYTVWEYRGPVPKEAFAAFLIGMHAQGQVSDEDAQALAGQLEADPLHEIDCEVWFSQGVVLKMAISTLEAAELGYYVFNYEKNPNSIFGHGVPFLCRDDQHAANQLWQAMMLNSMMSAGPQIGVRKSMLVAQPGRANSLSATKPRIWALSDEVEDINKALSVFVVPNVTDKMMGLYERVKQNADEHTMTPLIAQGEPTMAAPTSSGTAMLMNAANVVMRRLAKAWDDQITVPMIGAFYNWNMAHDPDQDSRGDFNVVAKGSSHLLIKDVMTQHLQFATQLFATNPMLAPYMKAGAFARKNVEMLDLDVDALLYTDDEVAANQQAQGQQPDPETIKAQAAMATAQAAQARAQSETAIAAHKKEFDMAQLQMSHEARLADIAARERIQQMQLRATQLSILEGLTKMESGERMHMAGLFADLTKHGASLDLQQHLGEMQQRVKAHQIASDETQSHLDRQHEAEQADAQRAHEVDIQKAQPNTSGE